MAHNYPIHAARFIQSNPWLSTEIKEYMLRYSVAVNELTTIFPENVLVTLLQKYGLKVSQIVVAYEVPPGFTRKGQYLTEFSPKILRENEPISDLYTPGFYGLSREPDESVKIILFMRENISKILRQRSLEHIKGAYNQFVRLREMLTVQKQNLDNPLSLVGILPGRLIAGGTKKFGREYQELLHMAHMTNKNSARFVKEAITRVLKKYNFDSNQLIVLGSRGALGREVLTHFSDATGFDTKDQGGNSIGDLLSRSSVIVDCTNGDGLNECIDLGYFLSGNHYIWMVESYPVPSIETIKKIKQKNLSIVIVHIKGVGTGSGGEFRKGYGNIIPFPVYGNIMPCCTGALGVSSDFVVTGPLYDETELG